MFSFAGVRSGRDLYVESAAVSVRSSERPRKLSPLMLGYVWKVDEIYRILRNNAGTI